MQKRVTKNLTFKQGRDCKKKGREVINSRDQIETLFSAGEKKRKGKKN